MVAAVVAAVLLTATSAGCTGQSAVDRDAGNRQGFVAGDGTRQQWPAGQRPAAPRITGELLDGSAFDSDTLRGQVVVVNFWGQWCAPCRREAKDLQAVHAATADRTVAFLGVNIRDDRDEAVAFERSFGLTYPSLYDPAGRVSLQFRQTPPNVTPATLVLDRDLGVAAVFRGPITETELRPVVDALAAESG
jgi:thiol-disulfide isomerase/thioredoxin